MMGLRNYYNVFKKIDNCIKFEKCWIMIYVVVNVIWFLSNC